MTAAQQPLLPVQHASPAPGGSSGPRRLSSQQPSPAKELVVAVQQGDVQGALRAASWACLRSPVLLLAVLALLMAAVGLAAWLLPQEPLPEALQRATRRHAGHGQRTFFEELTREEQQQLGQQQPGGTLSQRRERQRQHLDREQLLDSLIFPQPKSGTARDNVQHQAAERAALDAADGGLQGSGVDAIGDTGSTNDSEPVINIHEVAKVPPLFGSR